MSQPDETRVAAPVDLVTRLRWHARDRSNHYTALTAEAATEIERLRRDYDELLSRYEFDATIPLEDLRETISLLLQAVGEWFAGDVPPQLRNDWRFARAEGRPE